MRARMIGVEASEGSRPVAGRMTGFAQATDALIANGVLDELARAGLEIDRVVRPALQVGDEHDDPVIRLGHLNRHVAQAIADGFAVASPPLLAGGTCSHLIGMLAGLQGQFGAAAKIGLIWLDAHGDFNTPRTSHSGMLGGMPVAVAAGLCHPRWRELAGLTTPLPTNRIVMVDVRNLDPEEDDLIRATDVTVARFGPDWDPAPVIAAVDELASRVDHLYLHVDSDILDISLQPNHPTAEPDGPMLPPVLRVLAAAGATAKIRAGAVVSINVDMPGGDISLASGQSMLLGVAQAMTSAEAAV